MPATLNPRKPAWTLARRRACLRFGVRPNAFGNALGGSLVDAMQSKNSAQQSFRASEIAYQNANAPADSTTALSFAEDTAKRAASNNPFGISTAGTAGQGIALGEISDGAATRVDNMGQPLNGRSSYNSATQFGKIMSGVGNDSFGTTVGKLFDWATYTVPDAGQRAAEIRGQYGNDPRFAQLDQMRESPLGAIGWLGAKASGASPAAQQMWLDIGQSLDGLAMSGAALTGRAVAYTGARTMPELVGEPKLFEQYNRTRVDVEKEMFRTPNDELSVIISRDTGAEMSRQLVPGVRGNLNSEMLGNMEGNTFTHFHPSEGNFSLSDIRTGLASGAAEIRAVMDGRTVSLNFENAPRELLRNPAEVMNLMSSEGKAAFNAVNAATQQGLLPLQGSTPTANIKISDFAVKTFVERNPWVKYTETSGKY